MIDRDDTFELYDLRVEVVATDRPMVCGHRAGDWLEVRGEKPHASRRASPFPCTRWRRCCPFFRRNSASRTRTTG